MLIVIGRSGSVMLDEIGQMVTGGQLRMLSSHGIDPLYYLLIPRTFAVAVSVFVLTVVFLPVAIISGFLAASALGVTNLSALDFADEVLSAAGWADYLLIPVKTLITGYIIGFISCVLGPEVQAGVHGIRRQLPKAFVLSFDRHLSGRRPDVGSCLGCPCHPSLQGLWDPGMCSRWKASPCANRRIRRAGF